MTTRALGEILPTTELSQKSCRNYFLYREMLGEGGEGSIDLANYDREAPVLHVLVVGFHHKKGCQVITKHYMQLFAISPISSKTIVL